MDPNSLIPTPDVIPAPAWLFILLEQLLFLLHIVVINALLGAFLILLFRRLLTPGGKQEDLHQPVASKLPVFFALGINFAVPPLLFLQVVYGHLFYSSSILMSVYWILIIPLLILAYYLAYIHKAKFTSSPAIAKTVLSAAILIVLYIALVMVNNNSLMEQPEKWNMYFSNKGGTVLNLADNTFLPRYLHFITASIAVGALFYGIVAKFKKNNPDAEAQIKDALKIFAVATSVQVAVGFWYLLSLPEDIIPNFMGQNMAGTLFLMLGILGGIASIVTGFLGKFNLATGALLITLAAMIITRFNLRTMYLSDNFNPNNLEVNPQWGLFALFVLILLIGVGSIIYMLKISADKPERSVLK